LLTWREFRFRAGNCQLQLPVSGRSIYAITRMAKPDTKTFLQRTHTAKKIMVLDLGFLGDTVHLLPALWMVRQAYPQAELHCTVAEHITSLMDCVPWVDRAWGYMRYPRHATLRENFQMISRVRRERFDVLINLNGSDRSSWLTFLSGADERLGRMPEGGGPLFWKQMFTAHVQHPFEPEPVYLQRCHCLEKAGFPFTQPEFHVKIDPGHLRAADISETDENNYFHISPFTTADFKELPPEQLAEFIGTLGEKFPKKKLVLSCAPTERERRKMESLLPLLPARPWRVFAGNLNLIQLAAVIQRSAVHLCGDTGTLHLALMTGTRSVSWFWPNPGMQVWVPTGARHRTVVGTNEVDATYLGNVQTSTLIQAAQAVLGAAEIARRNPTTIP
jgi:ADP-heptose:LPS heptosyltransferase